MVSCSASHLWEGPVEGFKIAIAIAVAVCIVDSICLPSPESCFPVPHRAVADHPTFGLVVVQKPLRIDVVGALRAVLRHFGDGRGLGESGNATGNATRIATL